MIDTLKVIIDLKSQLTAISKPSGLWRQDIILGRLMGSPLATSFLVAIELALIWFMRLRPAHEIAGWLRPLVCLGLAPILVTSVGYVLQALIKVMASTSDEEWNSSLVTTNWRHAIFRRELLVFILLFPMLTSWVNWMAACKT